MVDRFSTLPDEVRCHILSFLPTQNAVATSILSKRWRLLWLSVPTLDFYDIRYLRNDKPYSSFRNFVHRVMLAREEHHQPITSFRLSCQASHFDLSNSDLNKWVNVAIKRGIEILDIEIPFSSSVPMLSLRRFILTCKTLVVLKLDALTLNAFSSVNLPSLKTLHLRDVTFIKPQYLTDLLNGCPFLEDFEATFLYYKQHDGGYTCKGAFKTLPMLVWAYILDPELSLPLKAFSLAASLGIAEDAVYIDDIHAFPNLTHMELMFSGDNWNFVLEMLRLCPKLRSFELEIMLNLAEHDVVWPSPIFVPECFFSQLEECYIIDYGGTESELLFARYIMLNSRALRTMTIWSVSSRDKDEMFNELALCPRSSPTCELFFEKT